MEVKMCRTSFGVKVTIINFNLPEKKIAIHFDCNSHFNMFSFQCISF